MIYSRCNQQLFLHFLKNCISFLLKLIQHYREDHIKTNIRKSISFTMVLQNQSHSLTTNLDETGRNKTSTKIKQNWMLLPSLVQYTTSIWHCRVSQVLQQKCQPVKMPKIYVCKISIMCTRVKKCSPSFTSVVLVEVVVLLPSRKGLHLPILPCSPNSAKH